MKRTSKDDSKLGVGCLVLFALPFAAVGVFAAYLMLSDLRDWTRMREWEEVPARILSAELITSRSDDSTTYRVEARYQYDYLGRTHTANRVALSNKADNVGSFHQDVYYELKRYRDSDQSFRCYVNPKEPSEAILYREIRWGLFGLESLFALLFGGVGFGLMYGARFAKKRIEDENKLKRIYPDQPWRWKPEWIDGRIPGGSKTAMIRACLFAAFWNLISLPLVFVIPAEVIDKGNKLALIGLLFPLVGLGLLVSAIRAIIRWRKFGRAVFEMTPGVIGGKLQGTIHTGVNLRPTDGFHLTLSCIQKETSGSGKHRNTSERVLWQDKRVLQRERLSYDRTRSEIPVLFQIPYDSKQSDDSDHSNKVFWRLEVEAQVPGIDYHTNFDVPVFRTPDSDPDFDLDESPLAEYQAPVNSVDDLRKAGIHAESSATGKRLVFNRARHKGVAFGMTVFCAIWTAAIAFLVIAEIPIVFTIVLALFDLFFIYFAIDLWLAKSWVNVEERSVTVSNGWFGVNKAKTIDRAQIKSIEAKRGMQAGNKLYYDIKLATEDGKSHTVAKYVDDLQLAKQAISEIEQVVLTANTV